ncbi:uncharacterized protein LOC142329169 isoform X9 [Lycorma delicatula]|uniref:uncharacterized protein LOC142329169 isoform X9 n=1 Tax=Lycorma delicatula TaxID=130591 RepID=UPI003F512E8C
MISIEQRMFLIDSFFKCGGRYSEQVKQNFREKFPNTNLPHRDSVRNLINKYLQTGSVEDRTRTGRPTVLTDEKIRDISQILSKNPEKSLRKLARESKISIFSAHKALQKLKLCPCSISAAESSAKNTKENKKIPDLLSEVQRKKAAAVKQEQSGEGESKQNHPSCSSSAPSFQDVGLSSTTENTEGNITGDLNKNEGDDENSILPMEVNLDDETEEPRDAQFNDTELDAEDPLNIDNTPTSTTVIETVPTPKIISTATVVNDDKPNEQKATGQNIHVRQNLTENPAPLPVVPVNPVRKRMQLKRPLPVSDILDGYNAKVSIEDEYKNYIDEDKAFLMSLLPAMKELTGPQKMEFKMTVLNELKRIRYPSSTPTPQTVGNLTVLPYAFQPIPNLANISHVIPIQQRTINPTTLQQVINKNSSTTQQTCKILSSQPPPLAAIIPQTVSATSAETAKQKQSPTVSSTATTAATVTAKPTPVEPPAKRASVSKDNNARSQPSATETKKTTSRRTPARRKPKKQAATNETQNNTEETQIITSDLTTPQDEEETRNDGELRTEIDLDEIKIEHIKVEPYDDEDTEDAMENC